ncbi:MAG: hypothetical protein JW950_13515 [Deltaproteobacteria bacterium]|nr:hypothetical protein [Deltaproteobacteria bacterium]
MKGLHRWICMLSIMTGFVFATPPALAASVSIPDDVLADAGIFKWKYGPGILTSRADIPGPGVRFVFSGLTGSGTAVTDDYSIDSRIGGGGSHKGDMTGYSGYTMYFYNESPYALGISLVMNTGYTGGSGQPPNDWTNDTFWQSDWLTMEPYHSYSLMLDFSDAIAYNGTDNESPHGLYSPEGDRFAINAYDRTEVSNIGFQIAYWGEGSAGGTIIAGSSPVPLPPTLFFFGAGLLGLARLVRKADR